VQAGQNTVPRAGKSQYFEVVGTYSSTNYIEVEQQILAEECDATVDILGYPGSYTSRDVQGMRDIQKIDVSSELVDSMNDDVCALFPKCSLVITHGSVTHGGDLPCYAVSTVGGMSGGPLIMNGKAIGNFLNQRSFLTKFTSIHIGYHSGRSNSGVSFAWDNLWKLLIDYHITGSSHDT
jgi:hypothetical protein